MIVINGFSEASSSSTMRDKIEKAMQLGNELLGFLSYYKPDQLHEFGKIWDEVMGSFIHPKEEIISEKIVEDSEPLERFNGAKVHHENNENVASDLVNLLNLNQPSKVSTFESRFRIGKAIRLGNKLLDFGNYHKSEKLEIATRSWGKILISIIRDVEFNNFKKRTRREHQNLDSIWVALTSGQIRKTKVNAKNKASDNPHTEL